jgi:sugar O-acyltransferase (sialic acid O-acetyltransferase NeuD family)
VGIISKKMKDIVIYGAGGFGREIACLIQLINGKNCQWNLIGFLDDNTAIWGTKNEYGTVLGGSEWLNKYEKDLACAIAVGSPNAVQSIVGRINNPKVSFPNLYAPTVTFLDKDSLKIGKGNIFCTNCFVSCNVTVGSFNLFNGYIPIGHDAVIGDCNVVMPSVNISGAVVMGNANFLGVQSVVLQGVKIGNNTRVGANSVIMRKTKDGFLYIGNPAKRVEL